MRDQRMDVFVGLLGIVDAPRICSDCMAMLSPEERQRLERFVHEKHQREFLLAHGLLRLALSHVEPEVDPAEWVFAADSYGRPLVSGSQTELPLHFSLSHTDGCVACVISPFEAVGIDVEATNRIGVLDILNASFSQKEISALRAINRRGVPTPIGTLSC